MNLAKMIDEANKQFKQNLSQFCNSKDFKNLTPESAIQFSQNLKSSLLESGKFLYRSFLQSFESDSDVLKPEDSLVRFKQVSNKRFLTPFGEIELERRIYQNDRGGKIHVPLDLKWGVDGEYTSPEVREAICFTTAHVTPIEAAQIFEKCSLYQPSVTAIKHVVSKVGEIVKVNSEEINMCIRKQEELPTSTKSVAVSLDGVNVLLNEQGVRKGRKVHREKLSYQNDEKTAFRNAMVGSISFYDRDEKGPKRINSIYSSHMPEFGFPTFKEIFENEVRHVIAKTPSNTKKILIIDGHHSLKGYVYDNPLFKGFDVLIDFYHAMDHLSLLSEFLFGKSNQKAKDWFKKWKTIFLEDEGAVDKLVRSISYFSGKKKGSLRKQINLQKKYFVKRKAYMNYAWNVKRKYPIGSGPVEAACKSVVKTRMCRSGMRWSREGGQNILDLRTYAKSNRWDSFWAEYQNWRMAA